MAGRVNQIKQVALPVFRVRVDHSCSLSKHCDASFPFHLYIMHIQCSFLEKYLFSTYLERVKDLRFVLLQFENCIGHL